MKQETARSSAGRIATGDYDAVIIGHSQFEKIPMSIGRQREQLEKQLDDIEHGIDDVQASKGEQFTVKQLMKTRKAIKTKLEKLNDTKRKDTVIDFEQLGVDRLFIDESHFYKNLYLYTKMRNVGGIAQTEAQKSSDLFMKCRYLDEITATVARFSQRVRLLAIQWLSCTPFRGTCSMTLLHRTVCSILTVGLLPLEKRLQLWN